MSTFILMKIWESVPQSYDRKARRFFGRDLDCAYDRLIDHIQEGQRVLDLGCGTGALALRAAEKGARVKGIDVNRGMLEIARAKAAEECLLNRLELEQKGIAELDNERGGEFDAVLSGLFFSELSADELAFGLKEIRRILKSGGLLLAVDETRPRSFGKKTAKTLLRFFLKIYVYLRTGRTTRVLADLPQRVEQAGFCVVSSRTNPGENIIEVVAQKEPPFEYE